MVLKHLREPCPISSPAVKDHVWIPQVAAAGRLIITRDAKIQEHAAEIGAVRQHGARMIALGSRDTTGTFNQLEVMRQWRAIDAVAREDRTIPPTAL